MLTVKHRLAAVIGLAVVLTAMPARTQEANPLLPVPPAAADAAAGHIPQVALYGLSETPCSAVPHTSGAEDWVLGYWSGLNDAMAAWSNADAITGHSAGDGAPIFDQVVQWCLAHPDYDLRYATGIIHTAFRLKGG